MTSPPPAPRALFAGLCTLDLAYLVDRFPQPNQKIAAHSQHLTAGGPATNAAVTFAFLDGAATLATALGRHPLATLIRHDLDAHRVSLLDLTPNHDGPPALSSISVHRATGQRTVVSANAAAYPPVRLHPHSFDPTQLSAVLLDGHHMPLCIEIATLARARSIPVILDAGSWKPGLETLLPLTDIAICSEDFQPPHLHGLPHTAAFLLHAGPHSVAITRGPRPIFWFTASGDSGEIPVPPIHPIDTLGAGDIFHGAFCRAHASGLPFPDALHFAAAVATESCLHYGTRSWMSALALHTRAAWNALLNG